MISAEKELLRLLPKVLRARDFHLYLEGGKRLTDLWLYGGRAVLGHKPSNTLRELKNAAERGLFTPLPHPTEKRFIKALGEFFPNRAFRLYLDESSMHRALTEAGFSPDAAPLSIQDPAFLSQNNENKRSVSLWRPFLDAASGAILIPVLPWPLGPAVLVPEKSMEDSFPAGELIPPVLLAPAARALHNLAAVLKLNRNQYSKIEKALKGSAWRRLGIYLTIEPYMDREKYKALFLRFLEGGFLLPPSPREPVILPLTMSGGEESNLAGLLGSNP